MQDGVTAGSEYGLGTVSPGAAPRGRPPSHSASLPRGSALPGTTPPPLPVSGNRRAPTSRETERMQARKNDLAFTIKYSFFKIVIGIRDYLDY